MFIKHDINLYDLNVALTLLCTVTYYWIVILSYDLQNNVLCNQLWGTWSCRRFEYNNVVSSKGEIKFSVKSVADTEITRNTRGITKVSLR